MNTLNYTKRAVPSMIFVAGMVLAGVGLLLYSEGRISFMATGFFVVPGIVIASAASLLIPSLRQMCERD